MASTITDNLPALPTDDLLGILVAIRSELAEADARRNALYARRLAVFRALRDREVGPKVIADSAGVSDVAVIQALRKAG